MIGVEVCIGDSKKFYKNTAKTHQQHIFLGLTLIETVSGIWFIFPCRKSCFHAQSYLSCRYKLFLYVFPVLFFHILRKMLRENLLTTQAVKSSIGFYECPPLVAVGGIPNAWHEIETPK